MNKDDQVEINISQNNEGNSISNEEENSKKRNNSCNNKKFHDIDEYFGKIRIYSIFYLKILKSKNK